MRSPGPLARKGVLRAVPPARRAPPAPCLPDAVSFLPRTERLVLPLTPLCRDSGRERAQSMVPRSGEASRKHERGAQEPSARLFRTAAVHSQVHHIFVSCEKTTHYGACEDRTNSRIDERTVIRRERCSHGGCRHPCDGVHDYRPADFGLPIDRPVVSPLLQPTLGICREDASYDIGEQPGPAL